MSRSLAGHSIMLTQLFFGAVLLQGCSTTGTDAGDGFGFGREVSAAEIARWDIDIKPDGTGLPAGQASAGQGAAIFAQKCAACHGAQGQGGPNDKLIAPYQAGVNYSLGTTTRTIGNYWPYATTLYDYINRAMPHNAPGSLPPQEVYALTAWLLNHNGVIEADQVINAETLPQVQMPAEGLFYWSEEAR